MCLINRKKSCILLTMNWKNCSFFIFPMLGIKILIVYYNI